MGEPGGLPSMGSHRVGHNWSDLAAAAAATQKMLKVKGSLYFNCLYNKGVYPGTGEPGGLPSMGSHGEGHDWSDLAAAGLHQDLCGP